LTETGRFRLHAEDIFIQYMPGELIDGHIDSLDVSKLELHYEPGENTQNDNSAEHAPQPGELIRILRKILREQLFFNTLSLHHVSLSGEPFEIFSDNTLRFTSATKQGAVYAKLSMHDKTSEISSVNSPQIVITRLSEDELTAELRLGNKSGELPASIELELNEKYITGNYRVNPASLQVWLQPFTKVKDVGGIGKLSGTLSLNFETENLTRATLTSTTDNISLESLNADNIELNINLEYANIESVHKFKFIDNTYITTGRINMSVMSLLNNRINMTGELSSADSWDYKATLSSDMVTAEYDSKQFRLAGLNVDLIANAENLKAEGSFSPASVPGQFDFGFVHSLTNGMGNASLKPSMPIDFNAEDNRLSQLLTPWPYPFDVFTGSIKLTSSAAWSKADHVSLDSEVIFEDVGGNVSEMIFSGLSFNHKLEILPELKSVGTSEISLDHIDSGITTSNISLHLALKPTDSGNMPKLVVQALQGEILGGTVSGNDMVYDLNSNTNSFLIKASDIDLSEIVKTQQLEGIFATGRLDGILPIEIDARGIHVENGGFSNKLRAGTIRYSPEAGTDALKQNPLTGIALDALKDFRYSHLQAGVNYLPDGLLSIKLELKGISPALDTDRPVHLNINTEQNLVSLLKSLRFAQGVSDSIDDRVRRQYEKTNENN
jgi:hypothetical protein